MPLYIQKFSNVVITDSICENSSIRLNEGRNFKTNSIILSCLKVSLNTAWNRLLLKPWYSNHTYLSNCVFSKISRLPCLLLISAVNKSISRLKFIISLQAVIITSRFSRASSITSMLLYLPHS